MLLGGTLRFYAYLLIFFGFLGAAVLLAKDLLPDVYKNYFIIFACLALIAHFGFQIFLEANKKRDLIRHYHEEIEDFRDWKSGEATYRILGNIKRLSRLGETTFDLNRCNLSGIHLKGLNLKKSLAILWVSAETRTFLGVAILSILDAKLTVSPMAV